MNKTRLKNNRGMATLETLPLIIIFIIMTSYTLGFFGVIHSAILHSIGARTYAFETFRNRSNVTYFRHQLGHPDAALSYRLRGNRIHTVQKNDPHSGADFIVTQRKISFGNIPNPPKQTSNRTVDDSKKINALTSQSRNRKVEANPVWLMIGYGICLNAACKGP